jgi:hypothetical protein
MKHLPIRSFSITIIILLILSGGLIIRNSLLEKLVLARINRFNASHLLNIQYTKVRFRGIKTIHFDSLTAVYNSSDTLLFAGSCSANPNVWRLLSGHIRFRSMHLENICLHIDVEKINNYPGSKKAKGSLPHNDSLGIDLQRISERLLHRFFASIPSKLEIINSSLTLSQDSVPADFYTPLLRLKKGEFSTEVILTTGEISQSAILAGSIRNRQQTLFFSLHPKNNNTRLLSPIARLLGAGVQYKSLAMNFAFMGRKAQKLQLAASILLDSIQIQDKYLSSTSVNLPGYSLNINLAIGERYFEIDSTSTLTLGKLTAHPYLKYVLHPADSLLLACSVTPFTVDAFKESLPPDLFPTIKNVEAEGSLAYKARLAVDLKNPDSLLLESHLYPIHFKIRHFDSELLKMNTDFLYTVYKNDVPIRTFQVGPENPVFCPLNQIPVLLQNAVLIAEDGSFYFHNGFIPESIRYAIAQNIKQRKLFRGGSTISQQLIKNVYLSHEKTLSRKLEEIMLVWLIESNHLVPKNRMFEVYLNIIEWGPGIYGAKEAARFYFNKQVEQLDASECIFMASVIPSPSKFYWRFDKEGSLAPFMLAYYDDMAVKIYGRGLLSSANGDSLAAGLKIDGPAKHYLRHETIPADSLVLLQNSVINLSE